MKMNKMFDALFKQVQKTMKTEKKPEEKLQEICKLLRERVDYYDWVGFYLVNQKKERELILGPFVGDPTEHVCIQFGVGICGQSAESKKTFVVQDVNKVTNYLSCSPAVKSEIVVPIMKGHDFVGELDIDSHVVSPFKHEDEEFLNAVCKEVSRLFEVTLPMDVAKKGEWTWKDWEVEGEKPNK